MRRTFSMLMLLAPLQALSPQAAGAQEVDTTVVLFFDEQGLSDEDRASLIDLVAQAVPLDQWRVVRGPPPESWEVAIDRYFDLFARAHPLSTAAMWRNAVEVNGIDLAEVDPLVVDSILLPPLPVRGMTRYDFPEVAKRTYDPTTGRYTVHAAGDSTDYAFRAVDAGELAPIRAVNLTAIDLPSGLDPATLERILEGPLPPAFTVRSQSGLAILELLRDGSCEEGPLDPRRSPYWAIARARLAGLDARIRQDLVERARRMPLVIVDWDVSASTPSTHGRKVRSVIELMISQLGLPELRPYVEDLDLNPAQNATQLGRLLEDFGRSRYARDNVRDEQLRESRRWLRESPTASGRDSYYVDDQVLQAVFWHLFDARPSWVNFSFTIRSRAINIAAPQFFRNSESFGAIAAGNEPWAINPLGVPQERASTAANMLNVTHSDRTGNILGATSDHDRNINVSVLAPGCGFSFNDIQASDAGSSFASPYVAVASWISHLLGVDRRDMRRSLLRSSVPLATLERRVESGGVFDPALLLSGLGPHVLLATDEVVTMESGTLTLAYADQAGMERSRTISLGAAEVGSTVHVFRCGGELCIWIRDVPAVPGLRPSVDWGRAIRVRLEATTNDGRVLRYLGAEEFAEAVRFVVF